MFNIPQIYMKNENIDTKTFITKDMTLADKKRFRESIVSAALTYQITGEQIPSIVNDERNCAVIMFLDIKLKSLKDTLFVADIVQNLIKALCIIRFYDSKNEVYSFAAKRLSKQNKNEIVIENTVISTPQPYGFPSETSELMAKYIAFDKIKNRTDKFAFYNEMMIKVFSISNLTLFSGMPELLDKNIWYDDVGELFLQLQELQRLKEQLKLCGLPAEKVKLNSEIKGLIENIRIGANINDK